MDDPHPLELAPPEIKSFGPVHMAALQRRYDESTVAEIPQLWGQYAGLAAELAPDENSAAYGVCQNFDEASGAFDYACAVIVPADTPLPDGLIAIDLPEHRYAVFSHAGHISEIKAVYEAIFGGALAAAGHESGSGPTLEVYRAQFNPETGDGGYEIWVAIQ